MNGKRFGIGLVAGILVGLAVVAASGGLGASVPLLSPRSGPATATGNTVETSTTTSVHYSTTISYSSASTGTGPTLTVTGTSSSSAKDVIGNATSSSSSAPPVEFSASGVTFPSAAISSISAQDVTSNAFLVVPIVVALIVGAALYRSAARRRGLVGDETSGD